MPCIVYRVPQAQSWSGVGTRVCPIIVIAIADTIQKLPTLSAKGLILSGQIHNTECQNRPTWVRRLRSSRRSPAVQRTDSLGNRLDSKKAWESLHYSTEGQFKTLVKGKVGVVCYVHVDCSSLSRKLHRSKLHRPMGRLRATDLSMTEATLLNLH